MSEAVPKRAAAEESATHETLTVLADTPKRIAHIARGRTDDARLARSCPETLSALDATGWSRRATFTGTTLGRDATVLSYAKRIADHEVGHLDQLRRTLGRPKA